MFKLIVEVKISSIWIHPFYMKKDSDRLGINSTSKKLENTFTDWEDVPGRPGMHYPKFNFLFLYDKENHIFKVPIGFSVERVVDILQRDNPTTPIEVIYNNQPYPIRKVEMKLKEGVEPRNDIQKEAIFFLLNEKNPGKFLTLATGYGKTFCVIYAAAKKNVPFLIITSKLAKQWIKQIKKFLDISDKDIYEIRGAESIKRLMRTKNPRHQFYVLSTNTLYSRMKIDPDLDKIFEKVGIGVKVFDEAHEFYKTNCEIDCNSNFAETYYLTATPMRSDSRENIRYSKMFSDIPKYGTETHYLNKNYIIGLVNFNSHPTQLEVKKAMRWRKNMLNAHIYAKQIMDSDKKKLLYFGLISYMITKIRNKINGKIMIVLTSLRQISELENFLSKYYKNLSVSRYDSTVKHDERLKAIESDIILTTFGIAYAGLDINNLSSVFSLSPFQSPIGTSQLLGRLSRNNETTYFIDFLDEGYPRMHIQRKNRMRELEPRSKKIFKTYISENDIRDHLENIIKGKV